MQVTIEHDDGPGLEWPRDLLDVAALVESGWQPRAFEQFIVKINSRCNLSCTYCHVYESVDQSWRDRPVRMSNVTVLALAQRIAEHVAAHQLTRLRVVLHGGEPLLAGAEAITYLCESVQAAVVPGTEVDFYVQTNGTLLSDALLDVLARHQVQVGVSLDGDAAVHNGRRVNAVDRGSHADVVAGIGRLCQPAYRHLFAGLLCVIDPFSDPVATYEGLIAHEPPAVDLLLPHANWSSPPPGFGRGSSAPYGEWLVGVFDRWYGASDRETSIRFFEEIISGVLGRPSRVESIGLSPVRLVVVETDGSIEQSDALKTAYPGAAGTGFHMERDGFDDALMHPGFVARQLGSDALSPTCRQCDLHPVCGGGFYPHRYRRGAGFLNPSVYCQDLMVLIRHISGRLRADLTAAGGVEPRHATSRRPR